MQFRSIVDRCVLAFRSVSGLTSSFFMPQLAVLKGTAEYPLIEVRFTTMYHFGFAFYLFVQHMMAQEQLHLEKLNDFIVNRRARPSALLPLWHVAGFALGAATALLGKEAAMACTVAVETAIGGHYNDQIRELLARGYDEAELLAIIKQNRDEELEHLDTGLENDAEKAPFYQLLSTLIQGGCRAAISVAKHV